MRRLRRLTWIAVAVAALAGAGAAIAWHGGLLKTDAVSADFRADRTSIRERTCVGSDGHTYRNARVVLVGTMTSSDSRLNGRVIFRLQIREDVTSGLGTTEGRMWVRDGDWTKTSGAVVGVLAGGKVNGALNGRVHRKGWLVANFAATWNGTTLDGELGKDSKFGSTNSAVIQSRFDHCTRSGGGIIEQSGTGKLEVKKVLIPSTDSGKFDLRIDGKPEASNVGDTGSTGEETVSAGKHEVSETAVGGAKLDDYTTSISCRDGNGTQIAVGGADADLDVTVAAGADVVCTITNTKKTQAAGKLEVVKKLDPSTDPGRFNLFIKQGGTTIDSESNEGHGGTTGERTVPAGTYEVSETAVEGTKLSDYKTSISCRDGGGTGTEIAEGGEDADLAVTVAAGADVVCVITNKRD